MRADKKRDWEKRGPWILPTLYSDHRNDLRVTLDCIVIARIHYGRLELPEATQMTKAKARNRKRKRLEQIKRRTTVPIWGRFLVELIILFVALASARAWISGDGFDEKTFLWAALVAIAIASLNEWQRRRKKKVTTE